MRWQSREQVKAIFVRAGGCESGEKGTAARFLEGDFGE